MFRYETEIARPVALWLKQQGAVCIGEEVEVGYGIPDMMAGIGSSQRLRNRRRQAGPVTNGVQLKLLEFCQVNRSIAELRAWAPQGYSALKQRVLKPLLEREMISQTSTGFRSRRVPRDPFDSLIAVELKLRATQQGFAQANSYRLFAESSYFAIPAARVGPKEMDQARTLGIGLLAVHENWCDEVVEPTGDRFVTAMQRRLSSELILDASRRSNGRPAGSPMFIAG